MEDVGVLKRQPGGWVERGSQKALGTQKQVGFFREPGRKGCSVDGLPQLTGLCRGPKLAINKHVDSSSLDLRVSS